MTQSQEIKEFNHNLNIYTKDINKLFRWKESLIIKGVCILFDNYKSIVCYNKATAKMLIIEIFNFLKSIVLIIKNNWIEQKYIQHKFNKYELIPLLIRNKFVVYDYLSNNNNLLDVNVRLLTKILQKYYISQTFESIKYDISFIIQICEQELGFILCK